MQRSGTDETKWRTRAPTLRGAELRMHQNGRRAPPGPDTPALGTATQHSDSPLSSVGGSVVCVWRRRGVARSVCLCLRSSVVICLLCRLLSLRGTEALKITN